MYNVACRRVSFSQGMSGAQRLKGATGTRDSKWKGPFRSTLTDGRERR